MYGLSFTANLLCASATLLFASATFRERSSEGPGEGDAAWDGAAGGVGTGLGVATAAPGRFFFIAASLAAISALRISIAVPQWCTGTSQTKGEQKDKYNGVSTASGRDGGPRRVSAPHALHDEG